MSLEAELKAAVIDALNKTGLKHGRDYLRMNSGKVKARGGFIHLHPEGTADFLIFPPQRVLWVELKGPKQTTRRERIEKQAEFAAAMQERGHEYVRAESVDEVLNAIRRKA